MIQLHDHSHPKGSRMAIGRSGGKQGAQIDQGTFPGTQIWKLPRFQGDAGLHDRWLFAFAKLLAEFGNGRLVGFEDIFFPNGVCGSRSNTGLPGRPSWGTSWKGFLGFCFPQEFSFWQPPNIFNKISWLSGSYNDAIFVILRPSNWANFYPAYWLSNIANLW